MPFHSAAKLIPMIEQRGVKLIRVGLHASEELENRVAGPFHPAFLELCAQQADAPPFDENVLESASSPKRFGSYDRC